jgi:diguanylate cyclase (GGDEF)-like protein
MSWWPWARRRVQRSSQDSSTLQPATNTPGTAPPELDGELGGRLLTDELTGLRNRFGFKDDLEQTLMAPPAAGPRPSALLVDLDGFGRVNESFGRAAGDEFLRVTADRLQSLVSPHETLYRVGGDQFAVLVDRATPEEAIALGGTLMLAVNEPITIEVASTRLTASVGVVMLGDRRRVDGVLRDADLTMHRAKIEGGNRVDIYSGELDYWALSRKRDIEGLEREIEDLRLENQALTEAIMIDPRTGLPNAAAFDADHLQVHARRSRSGDPYAVLLADIDQFHQYREHLPASAVHSALRAVGQTIKDTVRQGDRAYRYGWQDFVVLLPGASLREAVVAAERIRSTVEELHIEHPDSPSGILTVTVGAIEAGFRHATPKDIVAEVSDLVLEGKEAGGNRIVWPH